MIFETVFQCQESDNKIIIPLDPDWNVLCIQASGGADSSLLTYLTIKLIQEHGLKTKIKVFTTNVATKPLYIEGARAVINKITEITGFNQWDRAHEYSIPPDESLNPMRKFSIRNHLKALMMTKQIDYEFNGTTKNPPDDARKNFINDQYRQLDREGVTTIYSPGNTARPLIMCDKQGIFEMYKTHGLVDTILPLTVSCDADLAQITDGKFPCETKCWWCAERAWGLAVNGINAK